MRLRAFVVPRLPVFALFALGAGATSACSVYDPALLPGGGPNVDAGACLPGEVGCIPSKPADSTSDPLDSEDITFALRDVLLNQVLSSLPSDSPAQPWRNIGFNLDGMDSRKLGDPVGCRIYALPDGGVSTQTYPIDGNEGIDNQFGAVIGGNLLPIVNGNLQEDLCCMQSTGRGTLLIRIQNWNGQADDASVIVSMVSALDGTADDPDTLKFLAGAENGYVDMVTDTPASTPSWRPNQDTYWANSADIVGGMVNNPRHDDVAAYVSGGFLVMQMDPTQPVKLYLGRDHGINIGLRAGTLIGHISASKNYLDNGWIGGRMDADSLIDASYRLLAGDLYSSSARQMRDGQPVVGPSDDNLSGCTGSATPISGLITTFGDLLANGNNEPNTPCDAVSVGVSFRGVRVKEVRPGQSSLLIPFPDCPGYSLVLGTPTSDETLCPFRSSATVCRIPNWDMIVQSNP